MRPTLNVLSILAACAAFAPIISAAEEKPPTAADIVASYTAAATARAKADAQLTIVSQDLDGKISGIDAARPKIDNDRNSAQQKYDELFQAENKKGDIKDQGFMDAIQATKNKVEDKFRDTQGTRNDLDTRQRNDWGLSNSLRQALNNASVVESCLKDAHADISLMVQIYAEIEAKAADLDADAKDIGTTYAGLATTWDGELAKANAFAPGAAPAK
jgi:chromosome segregation ATPase